jgi:hypothetical protein
MLKLLNLKPNPWVMFVKEWAAKNGYSYGCALTKPEMREEYYVKHPKKMTKKQMAMSQPKLEPKLEPVKPLEKSKKIKSKPNIEFIIEEDEVVEPPKLEESVPTRNPKAQMKAIQTGTKENEEYEVANFTDEELRLLKKAYPVFFDKDAGYAKFDKDGKLIKLKKVLDAERSNSKQILIDGRFYVDERKLNKYTKRGSKVLSMFLKDKSDGFEKELDDVRAKEAGTFIEKIRDPEERFKKGLPPFGDRIKVPKLGYPIVTNSVTKRDRRAGIPARNWRQYEDDLYNIQKYFEAIEAMNKNREKNNGKLIVDYDQEVTEKEFFKEVFNVSNIDIILENIKEYKYYGYEFDVPEIIRPKKEEPAKKASAKKEKKK